MNFDKPFELRTEKHLKQVQLKFDAIPVHLTLYFHKIVFQPQAFSRKRWAPAGRPAPQKTRRPLGACRAATFLLKPVSEKNKSFISEPYKH